MKQGHIDLENTDNDYYITKEEMWFLLHFEHCTLN